MKKIFNVLSFMLFLFLIFIFVFFEVHLFIGRDGLLLFMNSPSYSKYYYENSEKTRVDYNVWVNGVAMEISLKTDAWVGLSIERFGKQYDLNAATLNPSEFIIINIPSENSYCLSPDDFFVKHSDLYITIDGENVESKKLTIRNLNLIRKYFERCFNEGSAVFTGNNFLLIEKFTHYNVILLIIFILHCTLHFKLTNKNFYIHRIKNNFILKNKKLLISVLWLFSYVLLIINVLSYMVTIL